MSNHMESMPKGYRIMEVGETKFVQEHGRLPCEVKDSAMEEWHPALLLHVDPLSGAPFSAFSELDGLEAWEECRIKAKDLEKSNVSN
jgi:hypothetical protein